MKEKCPLTRSARRRIASAIAYSRNPRPYNLSTSIPVLTMWVMGTNVLIFKEAGLLFSRLFSYEFALLAILCTMGLFFFPAVHGSYASVHGPVTALRSIKIRLWICLALALAAFTKVGRRLADDASTFRIKPRPDGPIFGSSPPEASAILRC